MSKKTGSRRAFLVAIVAIVIAAVAGGATWFTQLASRENTQTPQQATPTKTQAKRIGSVSEVSPGDMKEFSVNDTAILIVNLDGRLYGLSAKCTHMDCSLVGGKLEGKVLQCLCHRSEFDVTTGEVLRPPASEPLKTYKVYIEDENIMAEL